MSNEIDSPLPKIREFGGHDWHLTHIYRRNLPHWELSGSTYFITFRAHAEVGRPFYNGDLVTRMLWALNHADKESFDLNAFVVMPDHVHVIFKPHEGQKMIEAALEDTELLILDNLSCLLQKVKENDVDTWRPFQSWLLKLRRIG
jgi:REP element-mobilizing transposase RayT